MHIQKSKFWIFFFGFLFTGPIYNFIWPRVSWFVISNKYPYIFTQLTVQTRYFYYLLCGFPVQTRYYYYLLCVFPVQTRYYYYMLCVFPVQTRYCYYLLCGFPVQTRYCYYLLCGFPVRTRYARYETDWTICCVGSLYGLGMLDMKQTVLSVVWVPWGCRGRAGSRQGSCRWWVGPRTRAFRLI